VLGSLFYSYITFASKQAAASDKDLMPSNVVPSNSKGALIELQQADGDRR